MLSRPCDISNFSQRIIILIKIIWEKLLFFIFFLFIEVKAKKKKNEIFAVLLDKDKPFIIAEYKPGNQIIIIWDHLLNITLG